MMDEQKNVVTFYIFILWLRWPVQFAEFVERQIFDFYQSVMETELIVNSAVSTKRSNVTARSQFTVSGQVRGQTTDLKFGRT